MANPHNWQACQEDTDRKKRILYDLLIQHHAIQSYAPIKELKFLGKACNLAGTELLWWITKKPEAGRLEFSRAMRLGAMRNRKQQEQI